MNINRDFVGLIVIVFLNFLLLAINSYYYFVYHNLINLAAVASTFIVICYSCYGFGVISKWQ